MFKNYLKIALRNLASSKVFSLINIAGLATGLATCLLLMLYIHDESSYDQHYHDGERLYRLASKNGDGETWAAVSAPVAAGITSELPEVEAASRLLTFPDIETMLLKYDNGTTQKQFFESKGYYVDSNFFHVLTTSFIYGNAATALDAPNSIVLSASLSRRFFGEENPVGKVLQVNTPFGVFAYTVKAVFDNTGHPSHIPANYFLSMRNSDMWNWVQFQAKWASNNVFFTYIKLKPGSNELAFEQKLNACYHKKAGAEMKDAGYKKSLFLQPVKDIYLHSAIGNEIAANGNITYLYLAGSIGIFILLIACINFMNLTTARSQKRAREVGVRKVMGAGRATLIAQFMGESLLMSVVALVLAFALAWWLLPFLNTLTQKQMNLFEKPLLFAWGIGLTLLTGVLAGLYPAFYLSSFQPVKVLKGKIRNSFSATFIRKGLVVFQFAVSVCLVVAAIVIGQQLHFVQQRQLGFAQNQQIVLPLQHGYNNTESNYTALKNELLKYPQVKTVTCGSTYPGIPDLADMLFYAPDKKKTEPVDVRMSSVAYDYISSLGFILLSGNGFSANYAANDSTIILNEAAVKELGYTVEEAPGKRIPYKGGNGTTASMIIGGVVKNFHFESLHYAIKPFGFTTGMAGNRYGYVIINTATDQYTQLLKNIEQSWNRLLPGTPFTYSFLDQDFQRNYEKEVHTAQMVVYFTGIAIIIACLGLFGLAAFSAEQRTKEMGIRKVLGASAAGITALLSKDFLKLVVLAIVIATPLSGLMMNHWLQHFVYRIHLSWWMFALAGLLAMVVALLTVGFQAIKAAMKAPVKSLRTE